MEKQESEKFTADARSIEETGISNQVEDSYIDYAMSVIGGRALPDVRDGLKPVQRRVIYKMSELNVTSNTSHRKSSSIVGETMGDLHPHGDKAIYDSLVRMSQDFSLRVPLVDGQGNFGSMDGDPPAAMRYTEARMSTLAEDMIEDIEKDTVDFKSNYDNRLTEPEVLPSAVPNLLINGASGIAVGMTTDILPHNVNETINATIRRMREPDCTTSELMEEIKGPDFPTGGTIVGREGIKKAYKEGKGRITVRSDYTVDYDNNRIVVTAIPYKTKKSRIVERIAEYIDDGSLSEIVDVRDESDRNGVRIVINAKSKANLDVLENKLIERVLEETKTMNHIALVSGQPKKLSLTEMIDHYIEHRRSVVRRRSQFELDEAEERIHIVKGRLKALDDIEQIVETIRNSDDRDTAVSRLQDEYDFSKEQSEHITRMRLSSITGMKEQELKEEKKELKSTIETLRTILNNKQALDEKIIEELQEMKAKHGTERNTQIREDYQSVNNEDLIPEETVISILTEDNYLKRLNIDEFSQQNRGGKGVYGLYGEDDINQITVHSTHDRLLLVTDKGDVHDIKGYQIPESSRQAHGRNAINLVNIDTDERITSVVKYPEDSSGYLTIVTQEGNVKKTEAEDFKDVWNPGLRAIDIREDDEIVSSHITTEKDELLLATENGKSIRFSTEEVRPTGRTSRGVMGIDLSQNDRVVSSAVVSENTEEILTIKQNGLGKRTDKENHRNQSRNGKGIKSIRDGSLSEVLTVNEEHTELFVATKYGKIVRVSVSDISSFGRVSNGVTIISLDEGDSVAYAQLLSDESG